MKALWLNLAIFSSVLLLSAALPQDRNKDRHGLLNSDSSLENESSLQRRRPPMKVPGPKLKADEDIPEPTATETRKQLVGEGKGKKKDANLMKVEKDTQPLASPDDDSKGRERGKKGKGNNKDLVKKDEHPPNQEETQEERSREAPKPEKNTEAKQSEN